MGGEEADQQIHRLWGRLTQRQRQNYFSRKVASQEGIHCCFAFFVVVSFINDIVLGNSCNYKQEPEVEN